MIIFNNINIKVIGIGDCGINAVENIDKFSNVDIVAVHNFRLDLLNNCKNSTIKIDISKGLPIGLCSGSGFSFEDAEKGALNNKEEIEEVIKESNIVIIVADMGGNNGVGASPIIADLVKKNKAICISIAIKPFKFYGKNRICYSELGINNLKKFSDVLIETQ